MGDSIRYKREVMEMCHRLIPMMEKEEIQLMALVLNQTAKRLEKEGRVTDDK